MSEDVVSAPRPEIIFFDVGDTLIRAHPSWGQVYLAACREYGLDVDEPALERAFQETMAAGTWEIEGPFEATEEAAWARVVAFDERVMGALGHIDLPDDFYRRLGAAFAAREAWHVFPDVVPVLAAIGAAGIRRAIISNWVWGLPELLHDLELAADFELIVASARVGFQKPDGGIFRHALDATGVAPDRAMHIGDSFRADVLGARGAGIAPVLIDRSAPADAPRERSRIPPGDTIPLIRDLFGLLDLLDLARPSPVLRDAAG